MSNHARAYEGALLGLHARTSLHAGSGTALGIVDLPIQRERHTNWPMIQGSSIKGVLRDASREKVLASSNGGSREAANKDDELQALFGPAKIEQGSDSAFAGALCVSDARLLALPVRSLKGVFAWVTCPTVLHRLQRDAEIAGLKTSLDIGAIEQQLSTAVLAGAALTMKDGSKSRIMLEEFDYETAMNPSAACQAALDSIVELVTKLASPPGNASFLQGHLAILPDDDFGHLAQHATEVSARIALDYNTKTVSGGALFYQEFLPAESVLYCILLFDESRNKVKHGKAQDMRQLLLGGSSAPAWLPGFIQIGGDETTGKGICALKVHNGGQP